MFLATTGDGTLNLYQYHDASNQNLVKATKQAELLPPTWLNRNAGVAFGYGGKMLSFAPSAEQGSTLTIATRVEDPELVAGIRRFEDILEHRTIDQLCAAKVSNLTSTRDRWRRTSEMSQTGPSGCLCAPFPPERRRPCSAPWILTLCSRRNVSTRIG